MILKQKIGVVGNGFDHRQDVTQKLEFMIRIPINQHTD